MTDLELELHRRIDAALETIAAETGAPLKTVVVLSVENGLTALSACAPPASIADLCKRAFRAGRALRKQLHPGLTPTA